MTSDPATLFGPSGSLLDLTCERYIAGDLDELELAMVERHLQAHPPDQKRLWALRSNQASFDKRPTPAWLKAAQQAQHADRPPLQVVRPAPTGTHARRQAHWGGLLAAAAAVTFIALGVPRGPEGGVVPQPDEMRHRGPADTFRAKGAALELQIRSADQGDLVSGARVSPGEKLGFSVISEEPGELLILGIDSTGSAYGAYPQGSDRSTAVTGQAEALDLSTAVQLDEVGVLERFVALRCPEALTLAAASQALQAAALQHDRDQLLPPIREGCVQDEIVLHKGAAPTE